MAHILVIRFSALGDVAMTIPVIHSFAKQYPEHELTILSRSFIKPLFNNLPQNIHFKGVDFSQYKGVLGLERLYKEISQQSYDKVADFHGVLRSIYLTKRFRLSGTPTATIAKGRTGKKQLVRLHRKILKEQKSSFERYTDVLKELGFPVLLNFGSLFGEDKGDLNLISHFVKNKEEEKWVGIAPFAKHQGKIYPLELQEKVIAELNKHKNIRIFLFGGGEKEKLIFDRWSKTYSSVVSTIGQLGSIELELVLMSHLDVMLSMDSANMHLASLVDVPVVSIWGATHPYAGFMGWKQLPTNAIQLDLECRPCSVYGDKKCHRGDYACLNNIDPQLIIDKIIGIIR